MYVCVDIYIYIYIHKQTFSYFPIKMAFSSQSYISGAANLGAHRDFSGILRIHDQNMDQISYISILMNCSSEFWCPKSELSDMVRVWIKILRNWASPGTKARSDPIWKG